MRASRVDWLLFAALGFFWGSSYLFIKIGIGSLPPFTLIAGRLAIGALLLGIVLRVAGEPIPRDLATYRKLLVLSVISIAVPFFLITWGEQSIDSALAAILNATVPLFTIVFAAAAFTDEAITLNRLLGLVVGFVGVVLIVSRGLGAAGLGESSIAGELAMIGSSISYAVGNVYARRSVRGLRPMVPAFFQVFFAFLITGSLAVALERPWTVAPTREALVAVLWLGVFGSSLAYLVYFRLIRRWGATRTSMVAYLLPVVGITLGAIVLQETVDARILVGTTLVIGGVALVNSRRGTRRLVGRAAPASEPASPEPEIIA
jgi:drug/metabolite transporter (DMT)-like permease